MNLEGRIREIGGSQHTVSQLRQGTEWSENRLFFPLSQHWSLNSGLMLARQVLLTA
jgi:hypothetical protein